MKNIRIRRHDITLSPNYERVIIRPFMPGNAAGIHRIIDRVFRLTDEEVEQQMDSVRLEFSERHYDIELLLQAPFAKVQHHIAAAHLLARERQLLIGALFAAEYSLESAALFNPSMVLHPDQSGAPKGGLRFIISLRATGEGHISSIEFRAGTVTKNGTIQLDPVSRYVTTPEIISDPAYHKESFILKLQQMGFDNEQAWHVMDSLPENFSLKTLNESISQIKKRVDDPHNHDFMRALECIRWLADSNYEICFSENLAVSERIIFPVSANESNGIEDARFVRFVDDDGAVTYYATYTAYNGHDILPQLICTGDFLHFRILTLNGDGVQNKGMALFPRRINGRYAMLSRQDDENVLIMFSDGPHHWSDPKVILRPEAMWESVKIGNCGSPIETEAGWLVLTHGVGPMRKYCIGAALLDVDDPTRVIGRLRQPLLCPEGDEREGYVPNVVYSCGSMLHGRDLIIPFAISDRASVFSTVSLDDLLEALQTE
jgi:predicted GH43/DUF377 family glycosyl hydrolase